MPPWLVDPRFVGGAVQLGPGKTLQTAIDFVLRVVVRNVKHGDKPPSPQLGLNQLSSCKPRAGTVLERCRRMPARRANQCVFRGSGSRVVIPESSARRKARWASYCFALAYSCRSIPVLLRQVGLVFGAALRVRLHMEWIWLTLGDVIPRPASHWRRFPLDGRNVRGRDALVSTDASG